MGALLAKPLLAHAALGFITVEALLGVVGGLSAAALYVVFAFLDGSVGSTWVLAVSTALIGGLVGAEVPLLMTLLQRGRTAGPPMPAARWPTSTPPTTSARCSAGWCGRSCCCRIWA